MLQGRSLSKLNKIKIKNKKFHKLLSLDFNEENSIYKLEESFKKNFYPDIVIHCLGGSFGVNKTFSSKEDWIKVWNMNLGYSHEINNLVLPKMLKKFDELFIYRLLLLLFLKAMLHIYQQNML